MEEAHGFGISKIKKYLEVKTMAKSKKSPKTSKVTMVLSITNSIDKLTNAVLMQNSLLAKIGEDIVNLKDTTDYSHTLESACYGDCDACNDNACIADCESMYTIDDVYNYVDNIAGTIEAIKDMLEECIVDDDQQCDCEKCTESIDENLDEESLLTKVTPGEEA